MTFYSGPSSLGTCNTCGSPVADGGQSGAYCENRACLNSYWGGKTPEQALADQEERARQHRLAHVGHWVVGWQMPARGSGGGAWVAPDELATTCRTTVA